jgi:4'-phosphopantetheinyl transferase
MKAVLSLDELARAEKYRFAQHRDAFIAGRALLRTILGSYCSCAPEMLRFAYGDQHKPAIDAAESHLARTVSFNLSHSTNDLQIAVAAEGQLGIDVEDPRREFDVDGLVAECLTQEEARRLRGLASAQRRNAFVRYWIHKEAFLKCAGTGFSVSPNEVHVAFDDHGGSEMRCSNPMAAAVLFGRDLESEPGHLAAVATAERDCMIESIIV